MNEWMNECAARLLYLVISWVESARYLGVYLVS